MKSLFSRIFAYVETRQCIFTTGGDQRKISRSSSLTMRVKTTWFLVKKRQVGTKVLARAKPQCVVLLYGQHSVHRRRVVVRNDTGTTRKTSSIPKGWNNPRRDADRRLIPHLVLETPTFFICTTLDMQFHCSIKKRSVFRTWHCKY